MERKLTSSKNDCSVAGSQSRKGVSSAKAFTNASPFSRGGKIPIPASKPLKKKVKRTSMLDSMREKALNVQSLSELYDKQTLRENNKSYDGAVPIANANGTDTFLEPANLSDETRSQRRVYVVRHGERIDFTFGKDWIFRCFDRDGNYTRIDLNMPKSLPARPGGPLDFVKDSPLSAQGHFQAYSLGEAMREKSICIAHVYSSPSLRCVETATSILKGMELSLSVKVEPGLFEWLGWYTSGLPTFMSIDELHRSGYPVDRSYRELMSVSRFNMQEMTEEYYERCHATTRDILRRHEMEGGDILLVAHKGSVDVCTRLLRGKPPLPRHAFKLLVEKVPYCAISCIEERRTLHHHPSTEEGPLGRTPSRSWELVAPPIPSHTHKGNFQCDWKIWL